MTDGGWKAANLAEASVPALSKMIFWPPGWSWWFEESREEKEKTVPTGCVCDILFPERL